MYQAIKYFVDLLDNNQPYHVGDVFPREGLEVTEERLCELAGSANRQGVPVIQWEEPKQKPEQEVEPAAKPAAKRTRKPAQT